MATRTDEIRADIEETRAQLSATIEALQRKADISTRAQDSVEQAAGRVRVLYQDVREEAVHLADAGREQVVTLAQQGQERVEQVAAAGRERASETDRPLVVRAAAVGLAVLGSASYLLGRVKK